MCYNVYKLNKKENKMNGKKCYINSESWDGVIFNHHDAVEEFGEGGFKVLNVDELKEYFITLLGYEHKELLKKLTQDHIQKLTQNSTETELFNITTQILDELNYDFTSICSPEPFDNTDEIQMRYFSYAFKTYALIKSDCDLISIIRWYDKWDENY